MYKIYTDGNLFCDARSKELVLIDPVLTLEANKAGSLKFTIPATHPYKEELEVRKTLVDVYIDEEDEPIFEGICTNYSDDIYGQRKVVIEGDLTLLNDSILRPAHRQGRTSRQLLQDYINEHNSRVAEAYRFTVGSVTAKNSTDSITCFTNYNSTLKEIKEDLVDDIGGYLRIRHPNGVRTIDYLKESPNTSRQIIKLGENLINYKSNLDTKDVITSIVPLGARLETQTVEGLDDYVTIKSVNSGKDYLESSDAKATYGHVEAVVKWDDVNVPSILKTKAQAYLSDAQFADVSIEVQAVDLHYDNEDIPRFKLLDKVRVLSKPHGMDRYFVLMKQELHLNKPDSDKFTLGVTVVPTLSTSSANTNSEIAKSEDKFTSAISNATALITGNKGGYVYFNKNSEGQPEEIYIMDTNDVSTATKIWRWNQNGFGYSNDGGRTFGTAITMDGTIVADFIKAGTLSCNRLSGGTINGQTISGGSISGANVSGNTISGGTISGTSISGGSINGAVLTSGSKDSNGFYPIKINGDTLAFSQNGRVNMNYENDEGSLIGKNIMNFGLDGRGLPFINMCPSGLSMNCKHISLTGGLGGTGAYDYGADVYNTICFHGTVYNSSGGSVFTSDREAKKDISLLNKDKSSDFIYSLNPCEYRFVENESNRLHHGFIAQEVKESMHEDDWGIYVDENPTENGKKGLRYDEFIADVVATIQKQHEEIVELKGLINKLAESEVINV